MYRRDDPRLRRTLNQLSQNLESANESAQAGLYTFTQNYIDPCFSSIGACLRGCSATCFPSRDERLRRNRGRSRGRAELSFDFYDDWENDENDGLLGWGNDELGRLLAGTSSYGTTTQPGRDRGMSYSIRRDGRAGRRKSAVQPHDGGPDPTIIPSSSYFGFLSRLPFNIGGKGLRYKPSAADLREHPGSRRTTSEEEPLMEESSDENEDLPSAFGNQRRKRSETTGSGHTTDSLSSRGDIFPSEDEIDDAVPLDDEFATALERRTTGLVEESINSGYLGNAKCGSRSRLSIRTMSSRSTTSGGRVRGASAAATIEEVIVPTLTDLKQEEERLERDEESTIQRKRNAAQKLAVQRGLKNAGLSLDGDVTEVSPPYLPIGTSSTLEPAENAPTDVNVADPHRSSEDVVPFPSFDTPQTGAPETGTSESAALQDDPTDDRPSTAFIPAKLPNFDHQNICRGISSSLRDAA